MDRLFKTIHNTIYVNDAGKFWRKIHNPFIVPPETFFNTP